jgi:hypothetical protein
MTDTPRLVTQTEFPHGLRCMECDRSLKPGDLYITVPDGMAGDSFVEVIVCEGCA